MLTGRTSRWVPTGVFVVTACALAAATPNLTLHHAVTAWAITGAALVSAVRWGMNGGQRRG